MIIEGPFEKHASILQEFGCSCEDVIELQTHWQESHRKYHNIEHLDEILDLTFNFFKMKHVKESTDELHYKMLVITAIFHDAIYDPRSKTNEEDSAELFAKMCKPANIDNPDITADALDQIKKIILDSKDHTKPASSELSKKFLEFDLNGLAFGSLQRMIDDEKKIFKEYGFVDYAEYKVGRGSILRFFADHIKKNINPSSKIDEYIDWFENREIKIAVYPGSFNPLHKGHLDVLDKAEKIFDKVILAFGVNPEKNADMMSRLSNMDALKAKMPNYQIEFFEGMLTKYLKTKKYPVSVVKGLRNPTDFDSERLQLRFMEDMDPSISIVYIISDRKFEHLSSSAIRQIKLSGGSDLISGYIV